MVAPFDRRRLGRFIDQWIVDRFSADLLAARIEGDHFGRPAAWFREQDEAPFDPGDPEGRPRFVGEFDTAYRSDRDPEDRDVALSVGVPPCPRIEEMQRASPSFAALS